MCVERRLDVSRPARMGERDGVDVHGPNVNGSRKLGVARSSSLFVGWVNEACGGLAAGSRREG